MLLMATISLFLHPMLVHAGPYGATQCAPSRFGSNLGCTANDVSINTISVVGSPTSSCVGGQTIPLDLSVTVQFGSSTRYNIGIFVANDGKNPQLLAGSGGATQCSVAVLPTASPFLNLDSNACGDGNGTISSNTGKGTFTMYSVAVPCTTDGSGSTILYVPWLISWDQNSGTPTSCLDNTYPVPGTTSKCNTGTVSFPPGFTIVVLPSISITDGVTSIVSGDTLTYTIIVTNTTASPLSGAVFSVPAVTDLNINSVGCVAAGGATCPASPTVAAMQGTGIALPTMPNGSRVTFTVTGIYTGFPSSPTVLTNTAKVTVGGQTNIASDTDTVAVSPPGTVSNFNAFETSTSTGAVSGRIYTKLAGTAFGLDVVAITGGVPASGFYGAVKVELLANAGTPGSGYGANNCPSSGSVLQSIPSAAILAGRSTVNFSAVMGAYRDVRVRISYPAGSPSIVVCSNDSFAIRPPAFTLSSTNATGGVAATNSGSSGLPVIKAGTNFNLTATAIAGYDGTPFLDVSQVIGSAVAGTIAGSFGAASSSAGVASGDAFTYSEVGNVGFNANAVYDSSFTAIDQSADCTADFSNALVGGMYGCKIGSTAVPQTAGVSGFGRFIPDHFDTAVVPVSGVPMPCPTNLSAGITCPALYNGFVYSGQLFAVQVTAKNANCSLGTCGTTQNYVGSYAKAVTLSAWNNLGSTTTKNPSGFLANTSISSTAFASGIALVGTPTYTLASTTTVPTNIFMRADESAGDGVTSLQVPSANSVEGGVMVVSGRIKVSSAYGSQSLPLTLRATAQYYLATGWVNSITDSVTKLALTYGGTATATATLSPASRILSAGNLSIGLAAPNSAGTVMAHAAVDPVSPGNPVMQLLDGTATFGIYGNSGGYIYRREK